MKALSIWPEYATEIAMGWKTIEYRSWQTHYRGDLVICSSAKQQKGFVSGHALCIVEVVDMEEYGYKDYGWVLKNPRMIKPVPVKGKLNLWNYDGPIEIIPDEEWCVTEDASEEEAEAKWASFVKKYWEPLMGNNSKKQELKEIETTEKEIAREKTGALQEKKEEKTVAEFKYEIVKHIGVLSESAKGWTKELNLISWNGGSPKYDVRDWAPEHEKMGKGVTLTEDEAQKLKELLMDI